MLAPSIFGENLFDDWFNFPEFDNFSNRAERKLYGHHADKLMKTDVRESEDGYEIDIDLPGFKKEDITLDLNNGYLTVSATKGLDNEETNKKGRIIPDKAKTETELIPFTYEGGIEGYMEKEVRPYTPYAWIDDKKTTIGYELGFTKYFFHPREMRDRESIASEIRDVEAQLSGMLEAVLL